MIIAKPAAVNDGSVNEILAMVETHGLKVIGLKAEVLDVHHLEKDLHKEKDPAKKKLLEDASLIPSILIAAEGNAAVLVGKKIKEKYDWKVHVSASEEVGKYEITRFFKKEELFDYSKVGDLLEKMDLREKDFKGNFR
jgi:nucleoside diphosphate kinase